MVASVPWGAEAPAAGDGKRRAITVDQFEAVFTLCDDRDEWDGLVGALWHRTRLLARFAVVPDQAPALGYILGR